MTGDPEMRHGQDSLSMRLRPHALIRVVVPSRDRSGRLLAASELVRLVEAGLGAIARGCMTFNGTGLYIDDSGQEVREQVSIVESYLPERVGPRDRQAFGRLISELAERGGGARGRHRRASLPRPERTTAVERRRSRGGVLMDGLDAIRRRLQETHPRAVPDVIRQAIGEADGRIAKLENDATALREAWWVESSRLGEYPRPGEEPFVHPQRERIAWAFTVAGRAAVAIEVGLAAWWGWGGRILNAPALVSAFLCALLAYGIARITRGVVSAWLGNDDRPLETRRRLKRAAVFGGVAVLLALVPLLMALRGATDESLDLAIPASMVFLTLGLSFVGACLLELAESYDQVTARAYHAAVHELECERLFRQELERMLKTHPFAGRNGRSGRSSISRLVTGGLVIFALLLPGLTRAEAYRSVHVMVDTTGSVDRAILSSTAAAVAASLPVLVVALECETVEVSGWGSRSTWTPPGAAFPMPARTSPPSVVHEDPLGRYFASIAEARARKAEVLREHNTAEAERQRAELIRQACAEPAAALRRLADAGRVPEPRCSPVGELLLRASLEPSTRLTILLTDAVGCSEDLAVPASSTSKTVVVILPTGRPSVRGSVTAAIAKLKEPWLMVVPASTLDVEGGWVARLFGGGHTAANGGTEP